MTTQFQTVERKILFFRADIGEDGSGRPLDLDPNGVITAVTSLPFTEQGRYDLDQDGDAICIITDSSNHRGAFRFCRIRRSGLPQLEQAGQIQDLNIPITAGLLEATHVVFFPQNIVGVEYNHFGPRITRLSSYLVNKSGGLLTYMKFYSLLRPETSEQLDSLKDIRLVDLEVRTPYINKVRQADQSLYDALEANRRLIDEPEVVSITLKSSLQGRASTLDKIFNPLKILASNDDLQGNVNRFKVRGLSGTTDRVQTIDLLSDHIMSAKRIVRLNSRSRALDSTSAFDAIREAYRDHELALQTASGISS